MKKLWLLVLVLFSLLLCAGGCPDDCEGQSCSSSTSWCCENNVMECAGGTSRISRSCSGCCQVNCGPSGCAATCVSCGER